MSDEIKRLKDEEQANWEFDYEPQTTDELKAFERPIGDVIENDGGDFDYKPFVKSTVAVLLFGSIFFFMASNGVDFGPFGRYAWMIFLIPFFTGARHPNWIKLTFLFIVVTAIFNGGIFGYWWLIFLVPMFAGKRSQSR